MEDCEGGGAAATDITHAAHIIHATDIMQATHIIHATDITQSNRAPLLFLSPCAQNTSRGLRLCISGAPPHPNRHYAAPPLTPETYSRQGEQGLFLLPGASVKG